MIFTTDNIKEWLTIFAASIEEHKAYLSELDTPIGDGDHGSNMSRGMEAVMESINQLASDDIAEYFKKIAMSLISKVGGASGPLYGTSFLEMAKVSKETNEVVPILQAGFEGIKKRGQSDVLQKTMLDVWGPVVNQLETSTLDEKLIQDYVNSTLMMQAQKGRASYLGERSINHLDPGAQSSGYLFIALIKAGVI